MAVFGKLAGANLGEGIQKTFAEALRKKLESERALQQQMAMARLQNALQGQTQRDLLERRFAFDQINRLMESGQVEAARAFAQQYAPYLMPAVEAGAAGYQRQRDLDYLRQNWQKLTQHITDEKDAQRFVEAMKTGDVNAAYQIALKNRVPFAQLAQRQAEAATKKAEAGAKATELDVDFLEQTLGARVDQELLKAEGLDLSNERTRQLITHEGQRMAMELERWGIEKGILQSEAEGKELANRLLAARVKVAEATTDEEIRKATLEVESLEQRLLNGALDHEIKQLEKQLKEGQVDEFFKTRGLRLTATVEELARRSPEAAKSWLVKNGKVLEAAGIDPASMNQLVESYERLKQFEDPTRKNALSVVELALKTPPRDQAEAKERIASIEKTLDEAVKQGAMSEDEKRAYIEAVQAAWNGAIDALGMKMLELQLERDKLSQEAAGKAQDAWLDVLKMRVRTLSERLDAAREDRQLIRNKLIANQCQTELIQLAGQGFAVTPGAQAGSEECKRLAEEYQRADRVVAEVDSNLRAIDFALGGQELLTPGDKVERFVTSVRQSGKKLTPEEARAALARQVPDLPMEVINAVVNKMAEDGLVEGGQPPKEEPEKKAEPQGGEPKKQAPTVSDFAEELKRTGIYGRYRPTTSR